MILFASLYWYSFIKLNSYESLLICVKAMSYELKWDYMDIGAFHYLQEAKSILWTVTSCWPSEWVCVCVCVCIYIYTGLLQLCYELSIELPPILFFVCQLDTSCGCWASKCCYYCFLLYKLGQWLLLVDDCFDIKPCWVILWGSQFNNYDLHLYSQQK